MKKILVLDGSLEEFHGLQDLVRARRVTVITEGDFGNHNHYCMTPDYASLLQGAIGVHDFDLVLLGNNKGIGVEKGRALPERLRPKTIVVYYHTVEADDWAEYLRLGFTRKSPRNQVSIRTELGL